MAATVNIEIYEIMAEILITARRIVHRGLIKVSGPTWYEVGCPSGTFERLVARKENELEIDRVDRDYQELIGYASLDDLAEIIEYNEDLAKLLEVIAPKRSTIVEMFREIEALRLKLAAAAPFDDDDVETLYRYHSDFRDALDRRMQKKAEKPVPAESPLETDPVIVRPPEAEEKTGDEVGDEAAETDLPAKQEDEVAETDRPSEKDEVTEIDRPQEEEGESSKEFITAVTDSDTAEIDLADLWRAMADGDDLEILRVIRGEVMLVAEGVLHNDLRCETRVWDEVKSSGWFDGKKSDLGIEPLGEFYSVVESVRETRRSGGGLEAIKAHLQVSEFSKLLLALREMFLKHGI